MNIKVKLEELEPACDQVGIVNQATQLLYTICALPRQTGAYKTTKTDVWSKSERKGLQA
jgi:hypothetical protein